MHIKILVLAFLLTVGGVTAYGQTNPPATPSAQGIGTNTNTYLGSFYDQEDRAADRTRGTQPPNPLWTTIKFLLYIAVFGVIAYFIIKIVVKKGSLPATEDGKLVELIMTKQIGMGSYLQIVKVGPTYYLLSQSGDGLRYLDKIQDKETIDFLELNKENIKPKATKFFDFLSYLPLTKRTDRMGFLRDQKDKLKKM